MNHSRKKLNVAIFFGGCSSEYSVSLESAAAVISSLDRSLYEPVLIGISQKGDWFYYTGDVNSGTAPVSPSHVHAVGTIEVTVHNGLAVGDGVILIRQQEGQKFIVVDRIGK